MALLFLSAGLCFGLVKIKGYEMSESRCANVRRGFGLAVTVAGWLGCAAPAQADLIQFTFTGAITEIEGDAPDFWASVKIGDPWEVKYVFDSEAKDMQKAPQVGWWLLESFTVTMAGFSSTTTIGDIRLELNSPPPLDHYDAKGHDLPVGGSAGIGLVGVDTFKNDELPLTLDLDTFFSAYMEVGTGKGQGDYFMRGDVMSFKSATIPAPSVFLTLLVFGGVGLPVRSRFR